MTELLVKIIANINVYTIFFFEIYKPTIKAISILYEVFNIGVILISCAIFWYKYKNEKRILDIFEKCKNLPTRHRLTVFFLV